MDVLPASRRRDRAVRPRRGGPACAAGSMDRATTARRQPRARRGHALRGHRSGKRDLAPWLRQNSRRWASCSELSWRPGTSSATTRAFLGNAASTRRPSSSMARCGSRPLPRRPGSISISSSGSQCDKRFWYSPNPCATHVGARSPVAIRRAFNALPDSTRHDDPVWLAPSQYDQTSATSSASSAVRGAWSPTVHSRSNA